MHSFKIYGKWSVHSQIDRHTCAQCSHASVGLAQARPNYFVYYAYVYSLLNLYFVADSCDSTDSVVKATFLTPTLVRASGNE